MNLSMDIQQDIYLELLERLEAKGTTLADPNRTLLLPEKAAKAQAAPAASSARTSKPPTRSTTKAKVKKKA